MNNCQFKFKPDKIKYLSNIDTLDSTHKQTIETINKKHNDIPKKIKKLDKLKNDLKNIDINNSTTPNYVSVRSKMLDDISRIEEEINQIENYEDELEYYSKTYDILFNYYDIIDGMNPKEILQIKNEINNCNLVNDDDQIILDNDISETNIQLISETNNLVETSENVKSNEAWDFDGIQIFNNTKSNKLDLLNEMSKMKRKEKKITRKRVKNVESLIKDTNNNIFDYIEGNKSTFLNTIEQNYNTEFSNKISEPKIIYDRASLYEEYKMMTEGYQSKKKITRPCMNCNIEKILIHNEGIYACMKCGEVENCIIESEVTNYKDPMIEKPTFPYKRKNHFCEWTGTYNCSLKWILKRFASVIYNLLL